jgi:hypothetical protein
MNETVSRYVMNPAEDEIRFGDELADGMWVLCADPVFRSPHGHTEDEQMRQQRFRRVTRLRHDPARGSLPPQVAFVGEWVDGYQEVHSYSVQYGWLVKKAAQEDAR